ncbi:DUF485 domain-containing protein [uncultured Rubinisphaera sp.]|uniref:DUF485 domain-containing protein n=1 Tax=uncultured Rubinisphaera sp. TaxID=1678686 RepID=UPI0030D9BC10|tara:strand:- start:117 stop:371 length:255 start_codon:yes stop_codon:yes gene_type:complete
MLSTHNGRIAMTLFVIYLIFYSGFMLINVFTPQWMEWTPLAGVNLAIWYGFGLIGLAIFLAFLYGSLCRPVKSTSVEKSKEGQA